jgi:DNA-binding NarL/FixJ family response regulator
MDGKMPIIDGMEATQLIKSQWPEIRVILLTMCAEYQAKASAAGADASLLKIGGSVDALRAAILNA